MNPFARVRADPDALRTLFATPEWRAASCAELEAERPGHWRPDTKYAREAVAAGRAIHDLAWRWRGPRPAAPIDHGGADVEADT